MIDLFAPRAGQRLNDVDSLMLTAGGSATTVAVAAARLGASVSIATAIGDDVLGDEWMRRVTAMGVNVQAVTTIAGQLTPLSVSTVDLAGEKTYSFYRFRGFSDPLAELHLTESIEALASDVHILVVTEAALRAPTSRETVLSLLDRRRSNSERTNMLSVNYRPAGWARGAEAATVLADATARVDVICCNRHEYELLGREAAHSKLVFETLGADGVNVHADGEVLHCPACAPPGGVVLDTGAGDIFCAAVAVALGERQEPGAAAVFGAAAAALAVGGAGTTTSAPTRADVERLLGSKPPRPAVERV